MIRPDTVRTYETKDIPESQHGRISGNGDASERGGVEEIDY